MAFHFYTFKTHLMTSLATAVNGVRFAGIIFPGFHTMNLFTGKHLWSFMFKNLNNAIARSLYT